jgi:hypothetical protein
MTHANFELYRTISDDSLQELTDASHPFVARANEIFEEEVFHPLTIPKAAHSLIVASLKMKDSPSGCAEVRRTLKESRRNQPVSFPVSPYRTTAGKASSCSGDALFLSASRSNPVVSSPLLIGVHVVAPSMHTVHRQQPEAIPIELYDAAKVLNPEQVSYLAGIAISVCNEVPRVTYSEAFLRHAGNQAHLEVA